MDDIKLQRAKTNFLEGLAHFQASRLKEAEASFAISLALVPDRVSTLINLGATLFRLGKPAQAAPLLKRAAKAEPGNVEAWYNLGVVQRQMGDPVNALASLDKALAINPGSVAAIMHRAQTLGVLGRLEEAVAAFDALVAAQPQLGEAWSDRGTLLREAGRLDDAAASFEKAIDLGADPPLNRWFLAAVNGGNGNGNRAPDAAPRSYVEKLFDDYAHEFSEHLEDTLGYRAPATLVEHLLVMKPRQFRSVLDLGCGTGLCGKLIRPVADKVDGVDLSAQMINEAAKTRAYTALVHADVATYLKGEGANRSDDLVLAADVFIYVGALDEVFAGVAKILEPGGQFCFTVEPADEGEDLQLMPSLRYGHSVDYVKRLAAQHGFTVDDSFVSGLRNDQGEAVEGIYFYLTAK